MDCRVPQSYSLVMERPGPSSPEIMSPENFSLVSGKGLDGRDGLLGCLGQIIGVLSSALLLQSSAVVESVCALASPGVFAESKSLSILTGRRQSCVPFKIESTRWRC